MESPFGIKEEIWRDESAIFPDGYWKGWCQKYFQLLNVTASPGVTTATGFWHRQDRTITSFLPWSHPSLKICWFAWRMNCFAPLVEHCHSSNWVGKDESYMASHICPFLQSLPCSFCQSVQVWQIGYSVPITPCSSVWAPGNSWSYQTPVPSKYSALGLSLAICANVTITPLSCHFSGMKPGILG